MKQSRILSIYERNQLLKYGFSDDDLIARGDLPVEYLTGLVKFKNLSIKVDQRVLIPRVETEELIDLMSNFCFGLKSKLAYLEVGTGSGAISLAFYDFLMRQKNLQIDKFIMTDISKAALASAQNNFQNIFGQSGLNKVKFLQSNLLESFSQEKFNLIVANLPYIPSSEIEKLDASVKNHEPLLALDGGQTGFDLINQFLEQVLEKDLLIDAGKIFLEVYETHDIKFIKDNFSHIWQNFEIEEVKDQFNRHRFLVLTKNLTFSRSAQ